MQHNLFLQNSVVWTFATCPNLLQECCHSFADQCVPGCFKKSAIVVYEKAASRAGALSAAVAGQVVEYLPPTTGRVRGLKGE